MIEILCLRGAQIAHGGARDGRREQEAQGGANGPRIGPNPIPFPRFLAYVRNPPADMPPYTAKVISDDDLASIYAFLQARPQPKPVSSILLLAP